MPAIEAERKRVVVTGMGAISPLGNNVDDMWQGVITGRSGVEVIDPIFNSRVKIAGTIKDFIPPDVFESKEIRASVDITALYSTAASIEALKDANLTIKPEDEVGVRIGSGIGGSSYIGVVQNALNEGGDRKVPIKSILKILLERVASVPSMKLRARGPVASSVAACATGNQNIIDAVRIIREGDASVMLAGAFEGSINPIGLATFSQIRALSESNTPHEASRPFDKGANGFVMGEGGAALVLEDLDHAKERGAKIYAEILGWGESADAEDDVQPAKDGGGAVRAMLKALGKANLRPDDIDYVNTHGTSTPTGDGIEPEAILQVFGGCEPRPFVSSTKSMTGHLMGGAGAIEAVISIKAIQDGIVPPTINLDDPRNDYFDYVPNIAKRAMLKIVMSNSFGFGGLNTVVIFGEYVA